MCWIKENIKLFFGVGKKELISFFIGILILLIGFKIKAPQLNDTYIVIILVFLTMICRYNFVADYIYISDMRNLRINKNYGMYILAKNIFSLNIVAFIVFIVSLANFIITGHVNSLVYYLTLLNLGISIIMFNNFIFIFHNKLSELRDNEYSAIKNIELGYKDLIESTPSLISVALVFLFYKYVGLGSIIYTIIAWIFSVVFLRMKLKESLSINK